MAFFIARGRTDLPLANFQILEVWLGDRLSLVAYGERPVGSWRIGPDHAAPSTRISVGGPFEYRSSEGSLHHLEGGGSWLDLRPLFELRRARIVGAHADEGGRLEVLFDNGSRLVADPHPNFENWELSGPGDLSLVSPLGGGGPRTA